MLKDIPKVNTWLQETTLLQKIAVSAIGDHA